MLVFVQSPGAQFVHSSSLVHSNNSTECVRAIVNFLLDSINQMEFAKTDQLILIMGNTGSHKTLLHLLISGQELEVIKTSTGDYTISDRYNLMNQNSSSVIPVLMLDRVNGYESYIVPGFNNTFDIKRELTVMHLLQKALYFAEEVKFLFTFNIDPSIVMDISTRNVKSATNIESIASDQHVSVVVDFVKNATSLIKNVSKYEESIALVIMNVENLPDISDNKIIETILGLFRSAQHNFDVTTEEFKFIDILLKKEGHDFRSIGVFRATNQTGSLKDIPWMQDEKIRLSLLSHKKIKFIAKENDDFQFKLSSKTNGQIPALMTEVKNRLLDEIESLGWEIEQEFTRQESRLFDLDELYEQMNRAFEIMIQVNSKNPIKFETQLFEALKALKIEALGPHMQKISNHIYLFEFMQYAGKIDHSFPILRPLDKIKDYFYKSKLWYSFVINLYDIFLDYGVQNKTIKLESDIAKLIQEFIVSEHKQINVNKTSLQTFLKKVSNNIDPRVENISLNSFQMKRLSEIVNQTLSGSFHYTCKSDSLIVQANVLRISDMLDIPCIKTSNRIEITVLHKIFIDADVENWNGKLLAIISPTWEIIGKRRIDLSGMKGQSHDNAQAPNGKENDRNGKPGKPGYPGGPGGSFFGIGDKFLNDSSLEIILNGGIGGDGQIGGDGMN